MTVTVLCLCLCCACAVLRSDDLYRARWLSLLSVDDLVGEFVSTLTAAGVIENTYFLFTSDHGFRFGQYR